MSALKNIIVVGIAAGLMAPAFAFAQTSSTTAATQLAQIQAFQTQINLLKQQQQGIIANLVSTLRQGSASDQVSILQALLATDSSIYPEGTISGYFGKLTAQAVKRFQKKNGLDQIGNVGPKTLRKLQELLNEHPLAFNTASSTATSTANRGEDKRPCAIVPPGHLIAPGWLKKHEGEDKPVVPECQTLPPGIKKILDRDHSATTTPVTDLTAPTISNVSVSNLASSTATVAWTTNENASGKVYYTTSSPVNLSTAFTMSVPALTMSHSFGLSGLATSTTYYYVLESSDATYNIATTSAQSFVTTN